MIINLNTSFLNKVIKTNNAELRFKYNTNNDYFYFDLFDLDGNVTTLHNKVVTGYQFTGFKFTNANNESFANIDNVSAFKLVVDE